MDKATIDSARFSPFISRTFNDGSYLRSGAGSLWGLLPVSSILFSLGHYLQVLDQSVSLDQQGNWRHGTRVFDIFSGLIGISIIILGYLIVEASNNDIGALADIRFGFGLFSLACGPAILATSIRTIRKPAARKELIGGTELIDLTVGAFIAGWMTLITHRSFESICKYWFKIETVNNKVAISIALAFVGRLS
ncbi:MAG: hypothetical protein CM15mP49_35450 [Actinomycetota bacterium]|nr:MAG: hypothetical protein CM15mP49_35450 [Actinomycetota bacterium]